MILAILVPNYALAVALRARVELHAVPLLVVGERERIVGVNEVAAALGASVGQTLIQARACVPEAMILLDDADARAKQWEEILDALDAVSPLIEDAGEGAAFVDVRGDAQRTINLARDALADIALPYRIGVAANRWAARAAALIDDGCVCAPGHEAALVAPLPTALLPDLDTRTAEHLALLGVQTLGALAMLPHGPLVRRFGRHAARLHALARGIDDVPLVSRPRRLRIERTRVDAGDGGIEREDQLTFALRELVARITDDLVYAGRRCARLALVLELDDDTEHRIDVGVAEPTAHATALFAIIRARLEGLHLAAPVIGLRLTAEILVAAGAGDAALTLFTDGIGDTEALGVLIARLTAIVGMPPLRAELAPGHRPEAQHRFIPFIPPSSATHNHTTVAALRSQLRLVFPPRPISVITRRDASPEVVDKRRVLEYAGPWRSNEIWWRTDGQRIARDEYDVWLGGGILWRIACTVANWNLIGIYG